jgi:hypothetical protein
MKMSRLIKKIKRFQMMMMCRFQKKSNKNKNKKLKINHQADAYHRLMMYKKHHQELFYQMIQ